MKNFFKENPVSYGELADCFQHTFLNGRFKDFLYLGGNVVQYTQLQIGKAAAIAKATVIYNQEGMTDVINEETGEVDRILPLTPKQYFEWKELQRTFSD